MAEKHVGAHVKFAQQMIIAQIGLNAQTQRRVVGGEGRGLVVMQMMRVAAPDNTWHKWTLRYVAGTNRDIIAMANAQKGDILKKKNARLAVALYSKTHRETNIG